jgi:hypothetical protein
MISDDTWTRIIEWAVALAVVVLLAVGIYRTYQASQACEHQGGHWKANPAHCEPARER